MLCFATCLAAAQEAQSGDGSVADVARKVRAEKSKENKTVKVFTNDDLRALNKKDEATSPGAESAPKEKGQAAGPSREAKDNQANDKEEVKSQEGDSNAGSEGSDVHNEKYFRKRSAELNANLELHKRELSVLQQKLDLAQPVYYKDPQKQLEQEYSRSDITKLTNEVDAKKQQIADDEKAIDDLRDQLRRDDGDPGWLR
jgi:hypothetical protein